MEKSIVARYRRRKKAYQSQGEVSHRQGLKVSWLRVVTFLMTISFLFWAAQGASTGGYALSFGFFVAFLFSVSWHNRIKTRTALLFLLTTLNGEAEARLGGKWTDFTERGDDFVAPHHPYTADLQVFGPSSLFQHINTTFSFTGRRRLAALLGDQPDLAEVVLRQEAVKDLAQRLDFCQEFEATGRLAQLRDQDPAGVFAHLGQEPKAATGAMLKFLWLFPLLPLVMILGVLAGLWPMVFFTLPFTLQLAIALWGAVAIAPLFSGAERAARSLHHYVLLLQQLEKETFVAPHLVRQGKRLQASGKTASRQLRELSGIADLIALRYSQPFIYHPINLLFLWDWHTLSRLEKWKKQAAAQLPVYLEVMGEFEALSSLAILARDNPAWTFPEVKEGEPEIMGEEVGHPLILAERRVSNPLRLGPEGRTWIITGSNMSGKSTWLRTVGLNLVLAYAGAPVCAQKFTCTPLAIRCKMQVQDDLQGGISTFFAELKRIKGIIDAAETQKPVIFLLDEIFRGTNSRDRILATRIVVKKLLDQSTIGLITTHDLELSSLEDEHPGTVFNYHFSDRVDDAGIHFDHRLRRGVSPSTNALALMKMIGIEVEPSGVKKKRPEPGAS